MKNFIVAAIAAGAMTSFATVAVAAPVNRQGNPTIPTVGAVVPLPLHRVHHHVVVPLPKALPAERTEQVVTAAPSPIKDNTRMHFIFSLFSSAATLIFLFSIVAMIYILQNGLPAAVTLGSAVWTKLSGWFSTGVGDVKADLASVKADLASVKASVAVASAAPAPVVPVVVTGAAPMPIKS